MSSSENGLASLQLPTYIKTRKEDVIEKLYKPCLRNARIYVRGAGYFRSSVFRLMTEDLLDFCINKGRIILLTSTEWGREDYESTMKAYSDYEDNGIREDLTSLLEDPETVEPARMLCALIQNGNLDLRVAVLRGNIYHKKLGYFQDDDGNVVAFSGSGNETLSALKPFDDGNAESFSIDWNWGDGSWEKFGWNWKDDLDASLDPTRDSTFPVVSIKDLDPEFIGKWDIEVNLEAHREQARARQKRLTGKWDEVFGRGKVVESSQAVGKTTTGLPSSGIIDNKEMHREHQTKGLEEWKKNGRRGILEHATGSGKTITSLIAINEHVSGGDHAIVLVPSQPLLEQWDTEFQEHVPSITTGLMGGGNTDDGILKDMKHSTEGFVLISTIQSFRNEKVLRQVASLLNSGKSLMLVVDECHRIGAPSYERICSVGFPLTLGLSATPERQRDEEGTARLFGLLGDVVHTFDLDAALEANLLSEFEYHVKTASLSPEEQKRYDDLRAKIKYEYAIWKNSILTEMPASLEILIFQSRSIIRNAASKVDKAIETILSDQEAGQHWLVYCGEGMLDEIDRRITASTGKRPLRYWSGMDRYQRKTSLETFKNTGGVMLAIKCLDEGVDIPAISHGIVLSSSKTKREWIQRRGRLLRKSSKKDKSVIYDVLAFPSGTGIECDFVMDEVKRAAEFSKSCLNRVRVEADLEMLMIEYDISETDVVLNPEDGSELDE